MRVEENAKLLLWFVTGTTAMTVIFSVLSVIFNVSMWFALDGSGVVSMPRHLVFFEPRFGV